MDSNAKQFEFGKQYQLGKLGEKKVFEYLMSIDNMYKVEDLRLNKNYQALGVDGMYIEENSLGLLSGTFFDVKTDFMFPHTGNLFIEVSAGDRVSGILSTKASLFLYYIPHTGELYKLPIYALREYWYKKVGISYRHKEIKNIKGYITTGVPVAPIDLMDKVPIEKVQIGALTEEDLKNL